MSYLARVTRRGHMFAGDPKDCSQRAGNGITFFAYNATDESDNCDAVIVLAVVPGPLPLREIPNLVGSCSLVVSGWSS